MTELAKKFISAQGTSTHIGRDWVDMIQAGDLDHQWIYMDLISFTCLDELIRKTNINTIYDIGCGRCYLSKLAKFHGVRYVGVDIEKQSNSHICSDHTYENSDAKQFISRISTHDSESRLFVLKDVLEHFRDKKDALSALGMLMSAMGRDDYLFISTPNYTGKLEFPYAHSYELSMKEVVKVIEKKCKLLGVIGNSSNIKRDSGIMLPNFKMAVLSFSEKCPKNFILVARGTA